MSVSLTNLDYSEKDIGEKIKISKKQYIWEFNLNGSPQRIELLDSKISHKKRIFKNGISILQTTDEGNFLHTFDIDGHECVIIQYGDKMELRVDNQSFTHLYNLQKNKQLFAGEKGPTSNIYVAKPYNSYGSYEQKNKQNDESAFYKVSNAKVEEDNKPKLFNFEIKKESGNKSHGFNSKFKFGQNKEKSSSKSVNNNNSFNNMQNDNSNINNKIDNKNENIDLLGFQNQETNTNKIDNNINNNLLDFSDNNNSNINNQSNQNPQNSGNDIFDIFGNNNNKNNNNLNDNNNPYNNIFLQISDGTNQQPKFDQNNLGFLDLSSNMKNNNIKDNMNNMINNNSNNMQNQQVNQNISQNKENEQNKGLNLDLLNF